MNYLPTKELITACRLLLQADTPKVRAARSAAQNVLYGLPPATRKPFEQALTAHLRRPHSLALEDALLKYDAAVPLVQARRLRTLYCTVLFERTAS